MAVFCFCKEQYPRGKFAPFFPSKPLTTTQKEYIMAKRKKAAKKTAKKAKKRKKATKKAAKRKK